MEIIKRRNIGKSSTLQDISKAEKFNSIPVRVTIIGLLQMALISRLQFFIILTNCP
jgi:hypothetical protein